MKMIVYLYTLSFPFIAYYLVGNYKIYWLEKGYKLFSKCCCFHQPRRWPHFSKHAVYCRFVSLYMLICIISADSALFCFIFMHHLKLRAYTMNSPMSLNLYLWKGNQCQAGFSALNDPEIQMNQWYCSFCRHRKGCSTRRCAALIHCHWPFHRLTLHLLNKKSICASYFQFLLLAPDL